MTRFVEGVQLPDGAAKFAMMGELLGRLHALPHEDSVSRPAGASGEDPSREGTPRQDLLAALSFPDAVDTKVSAAERERFEQLRDQVRSADDGHGLPEGLLHGNLLHAPDHAVLSEQGPVAINWKAFTRVLQLHRSCSPSRVPPAGRQCGKGTTVVRQRRGGVLARACPWRSRRTSSSGSARYAWRLPEVTVRVDPDEREALLSIGHPFFASRAGRDRTGVLLTDDTDWIRANIT